jgi:uncharacterized membrane protein
MFWNKAVLLPLMMAVILNAAAQLLIKRGAVGSTLGFDIQGIKSLLLNGWIICGLLAQIIAALFWFKVLSVANLNVVFPVFISLLFLLLLVLSWLMLGETLNFKQGIGIILVIVGISLLVK